MEVETSHFVFHCPYYENERRILLASIRDIGKKYYLTELCFQKFGSGFANIISS